MPVSTPTIAERRGRPVRALSFEAIQAEVNLREACARLEAEEKRLQLQIEMMRRQQFGLSGNRYGLYHYPPQPQRPIAPASHQSGLFSQPRPQRRIASAPIARSLDALDRYK